MNGHELDRRAAQALGTARFQVDRLAEAARPGENEAVAMRADNAYRWDEARFDRMIEICSAAHMATENAIKALTAGVTRRPPKHEHRIEVLLAALPIPAGGAVQGADLAARAQGSESLADSCHLRPMRRSPSRFWPRSLPTTPLTSTAPLLRRAVTQHPKSSPGRAATSNWCERPSGCKRASDRRMTPATSSCCATSRRSPSRRTPQGTWRPIRRPCGSP